MVELRLKCEKPEKISYTITATMTAEEWETVRERLKASAPEHYDGYEPTGKFISMIDDLLAQARKVYWPSAAVIQPKPQKPPNVATQPAPLSTPTGPQPGDLDYDGPPPTSNSKQGD